MQFRLRPVSGAKLYAQLKDGYTSSLTATTSAMAAIALG